MPLFAQRVEERANDAEMVGSVERTEAARDLQVDLGHAHGALGRIVSGRNVEVADQAQNRVGMEAGTTQQVSRHGLLEAPLAAGGSGSIEPFAFAHNVVVAGADGQHIVVAERDLLLARRRARLAGIEQ